MADFSIGSVGTQLGDIQRTYTWQLLITPPTSVVAEADLGADPTNELAIRCRSVVIPGRSQDQITSNFMGMEQFFPGKVHFTNPFNIVFEEFADRKIAKFLYYWQQRLFNTREGAGGGAGGALKSDLVANPCFLQMLNYDGTLVTKGNLGLIQINNAWPESVAEVAMSYADNNALQYTLSLRYDTWNYVTA